MSCGFLGLYRSCQIYCATVQQQLFSQCCLTRIRMRNYRKCAASLYFFSNLIHIRIDPILRIISDPVILPGAGSKSGVFKYIDEFRICAGSCKHIDDLFDHFL